jgi:futalosine hydrolase
MRILLVAAINMEVKMFLNECRLIKAINDNYKTYRLENTTFDLLITGIGTTFTSYHLTQSLNQFKYQLVVNVGVAGSLSADLHIGDVVNVVDEEFADLGIEEENEFLTLFDSGFMNPDEFPFENRLLRADNLPYAAILPRVKGITTNTSHGRRSSINRLKTHFSAQVESMEGAAVFYVCRWFGVPCLQIRAISNYVAPRAEAQWDIPLALDNLKNTLSDLLQEIDHQVN